MQPSAELRWFWPHAVPSEVEAWFRSGAPPGGGATRTDLYLSDPGQPEVGIKRRGERPGVEIKGLVGVAALIRSEPFAGRVEIWCKWSSPTLRIDDLPTVATSKTRWLRKFALDGPLLREIELDRDEKPKHGEALPGTGCNLELTRVVLPASGPAEWWTLGFESFGPLDSIEQILHATVHHLAPSAPPMSGAIETSYPRWLARAIGGARGSNPVGEAGS